MQWKGRRRSRNIEDRRGQPAGRRAAKGGIGMVIVVLIAMAFGLDLTPLLQGGVAPSEPAGRVTQIDEERANFSAVVLADTEEVWAKIFRDQVGRTYQPPKLVLFSGTTHGGACGIAQSSTGPFYCPANRKAYLDTDFFVTLDRQLGAKGDFAAAYVIAHEVAHHVQNELGIMAQANKIRAQVSQTQNNAISVRMELQADCYAGIWARHASEMFGTIDRSDIREAVNAAKEIGDDTLQREAGGVVRPETFTHGSSAQRQRWFLNGFKSGQLVDCDTFSQSAL